ncbi:aldehyde dehydrogenase family protein [Brevundimonas intermedia]|uniref:aldehyde dehydrogenase family protein n=1 Tax=Brevundimonas intermedia TaxID=74315 RepID=UPI0035A24389
MESRIGDTIIRREPIGVCVLISPPNSPVQMPMIKAIYGIATRHWISAPPPKARRDPARRQHQS